MRWLFRRRDRSATPRADRLVARAADGPADAPPASEVVYPPLFELPWVSASWIGFPTLKDGNGAVSKTTGVAHYRDSIEAAYRQFGPLVMAEMRVEQTGPFAGAVRVHIAGLQVGAIAHGHAEPYREIIHGLNRERKPATCHAEIELGEYVDVWLSAKPKARDPNDPFIPDVGPGIPVELSEQGHAYLQDRLGTRAKNKRIKRLAEVERRGQTWHLTVEDQSLGTLPSAHYQRLEQAHRAGSPMNCRVGIVRQEGRPLRVSAGIPLR